MQKFFPQGSTWEIAGVVIAGTQDIPLPSGNKPRIRSTEQSDPGETYVAGRPDLDAVDVTLRYIPTDPGQVLLRANHEAVGQTSVAFAAQSPFIDGDAVRVEYSAYVVTMPGNLPLDDIAEVTVTIQPTTLPVYSIVEEES